MACLKYGCAMLTKAGFTKGIQVSLYDGLYDEKIQGEIRRAEKTRH